MADTFDTQAIKDLDKLETEAAAAPKLGEDGYVLKVGDPGYVLKEGDDGYKPELKLGDDGYVLKEGDPGYKAPELKPGDAGYVDPNKKSDEQIAADAEAEKRFLAQLGVKTMEEAIEKLKTPDSPEVLKKKEDVYNAAVDQFAVTGEYMKRDELVKLANLRTATPENIVFADYESGRKAKDANVTAEQIKQDFDLLYHRLSDNEVLKTQGEEEIASKAKGIVGALEDKYKEAKEDYDAQNSERARVPEYKNTIQGVLKSIPDVVTLYKDGEDEPITFNITEDDRKAAEKFLVDKDSFAEFLKNGTGQPFLDLMKDRLEGFLKLKQYDARIKTAYEAGVSKGGKNGSNTGADASFKIEGADKKITVDDANLSDEDKAKVGRTFGG